MIVPAGRLRRVGALTLSGLLLAGATAAQAQCHGDECKPPPRSAPARPAPEPPGGYHPRTAPPIAGTYAPPGGVARPYGPSGAAPYARAQSRPPRPVYSQTRRFSYRGRTSQAFRVAPYRYPYGYAYRRYAGGERFPLALLIAPYFITDFAYLGLVAPAPGLEWVRYGPDALLVNTYTGEVVDVAYGVFDEDPAYAGDPPPPGHDPQGYPPPPPGAQPGYYDPQGDPPPPGPPQA